ncbi:MAG TPA: hypothetical protein VE326_14625 [Candidatus Binatia bacterium]|nr:hypothetical protein [Candidatus Binatia bacterium]
MKRAGFTAITVYALAMALVEAACVVSLKRLYFPEGWRPPFHAIPAEGLRLEQWREVATLVMIAAVALLGRPPGRIALARGLWIFGVWDLAYYGFLRWLTGFPRSLADLDVVFLVPRAWVAPVWVAVVGSAACLAVALFLARFRGRGIGVW